MKYPLNMHVNNCTTNLNVFTNSSFFDLSPYNQINQWDKDQETNDY